jgi:hypothetical protein
MLKNAPDSIGAFFLQRFGVTDCQLKKYGMKQIMMMMAAALLTVSCKKEAVINAQQGDNLIDEGSCVQNIKGQSNVSVCFNKLLEDSRCPANAVCFWRGAAVAEFTLKTGSGPVTFKLADLKILSYTNDTTINNIRFTLKEVTPYPGEAGYETKKKNVRLEIQ